MDKKPHNLPAKPTAPDNVRTKLQQIADLSDVELEQVRGGSSYISRGPVPTLVS